MDVYGNESLPRKKKELYMYIQPKFSSPLYNWVVPTRSPGGRSPRSCDAPMSGEAQRLDRRRVAQMSCGGAMAYGGQRLLTRAAKQYYTVRPQKKKTKNKSRNVTYSNTTNLTEMSKFLVLGYVVSNTMDMSYLILCWVCMGRREYSVCTK